MTSEQVERALWWHFRRKLMERSRWRARYYHKQGGSIVIECHYVISG